MEFSFKLPSWLSELFTHCDDRFHTREDRMHFVIRVARENIQRQTGGPFGAGVFDEKGRLIALGINVVVPCHCSILHAEMVALILAQKNLKHYDMSQVGQGDYELVTSTEPCAMCFGAIPWSGVTRLVCGARDEDARAIGFDEGPKLPNWSDELEMRGLEVVRDVLRPEAVDVLKLYENEGGIVYNAGDSCPT